jgi:hypothetical protein
MAPLGHGQLGTSPSTLPNLPNLPAGLQAMNLIISRKSMYQPVFAHRQQMEELKSRRIQVAAGQRVEGQLWAQAGETFDYRGGTFLGNIHSVQQFITTHQQVTREETEESTKRFYFAHRLLHGFYSSDRVESMEWSMKKAKQSEVDLAIDAILNECRSKTLFCYGNGNFRTGLNLASPHESFKSRFARKVNIILPFDIFAWDQYQKKEKKKTWY